jgi:hypothetical protein
MTDSELNLTLDTFLFIVLNRLSDFLLFCSSVRLEDRGSRVRFPAKAGNFSLHHCVQNGSGAHPASYPMGTRGSFLGVKAARS